MNFRGESDLPPVASATSREHLPSAGSARGPDVEPGPGWLSMAARRLDGGTQTFGQLIKAEWTFLPALLDAGQHLSSRVNCLQNQRNQGRSELRLAVAQLAQLGPMRDPLQRRKREEAARTLNGVNNAEDACQQRRVLRGLLK